jgi:hypothetical protein
VIDPHAAVLAFLEAQEGLEGVAIHAGRDVPPEGYTPGDDGDAIVFRIRGGTFDYEDALILPSVQFKCYATDEVDAYDLYRTLHGVLQLGHDGSILNAEAETIGQLLEEPETGWRFVLAFYTVMVRNN